MNERLEKEIDSYIATHFSEAYDGTLLSDATRTELAIIDVAPMARYFYKLALEDVKREVKAIYEIRTDSGSSGNIYFDGFCTACEQTLRIIDNLTK